MIDAIVKRYKDILRLEYPSHLSLFCNRLYINAESARAEAVTYSLFRALSDEVTIAENVATGGADFLCITQKGKFIVEVTCLEGKAVSEQAGLPYLVRKDGTGGSLRTITHMLRTKASTKTTQLSGYNMPRVLVITCEHFSADFLLGPFGAEMFLTSDTMVTVPIETIEPNDEKYYLSTDFKDSVFFREKNGVVESCRRSISTIFLISIFADKSLVVGVLHPDPQHAFPVALLPSVPFLKIKKWPLENHRIETEWIMMDHSPKPATFYHRSW